MERGTKVRYVKAHVSHNQWLKKHVGQVGAVESEANGRVLVYFGSERFWIHPKWLEVSE